MVALSHRLAAAMASRLASVIPRPLTVRANGEAVNVYTEAAPSKALGGSAAAAIVEDDDGRTLDEKIETAVLAILSGVQDSVAEELREPWPRVAEHGMALPNTRRQGGQVYSWFGDDEAAATIALRPLAIAEIASLR